MVARKANFKIPPTVKLFENTNVNPKIFAVVTAVSVFQVPLWFYLSYFAITQLNPSQLKKDKEETGSGKDLSSATQEEKMKGKGKETKLEGKDKETKLKDKDKEAKRNRMPLAILGKDKEDEGVPLAIQIQGKGKDEGVPFAFQDEEAGRDAVDIAIYKELEGKHEEITENVEKSGDGFVQWFMSPKWRLALSMLSLGFATIVTLTAFWYPLRVVRSVTYLRPTQTLQFVTCSPVGRLRTLQMPLVDVTCKTTPTKQAQGPYVALKVKGHAFFFLLNMNNANFSPLLRSLVLSRIEK